jgi:hypothetical protein
VNILYLPSILAGLALLVAPSLVHGQARKPSFYVGVKAGYSTYTMAGEEVALHTQQGPDDLERDQWVTGGVIARKRLYGPLSLQAEVTYVREGGHFKGGYFLGKTVYTIDCLQLPLLLDVEVPAAEHLSVHLQGGMALTKVVQGVQLDRASFDTGNSWTNASSFFSPLVGGELAWQQGQQVYFLSARYTHDLTDYYQRHYHGTRYNARSGGVCLTVGTLFGL